MDGTYIKVGGEWKCLYRTVDRDVDTIDSLLCVHRDCAAAGCFFERATDLHGVPGTIGGPPRAQRGPRLCGAKRRVGTVKNRLHAPLLASRSAFCKNQRGLHQFVAIIGAAPALDHDSRLCMGSPQRPGLFESSQPKSERATSLAT